MNIEMETKNISVPPTQDIVTPMGMIYKSGGKTRSANVTAVASEIKISYADNAVKYELNVRK